MLHRLAKQLIADGNALALPEVAVEYGRRRHLVRPAVTVRPEGAALDPGLKRWATRLGRLAAEAGMPGRAHLLDGALPADPVILGCQGVVTINSTLAVQAIVLGRPVLALGRAIYQVPGLAWQGTPDDFWQQAPPPDPLLAGAWIRGIAACLHVRGRFYGRPGLDVAVAGAVRRLHLNLINQPLPDEAA